MSKGGLSNKLLGRKIIPQPGLERLWPKKPGVPFEKHDIELSDLLFTEAEIVAAWVEKEGGEESHVKVSAVSDAGHVGEFYLKWVQLKPQGSVFVKPKVVDVDDLHICPTCGEWEDAKGQHYHIEDGESPQPIAKEHE